MTLVIDIETVPLMSAMDLPYPEADRQPPANYKNADAIERWRTTDTARWEEERTKECSLNPRLGRVVCLGYTLDGQPYADTAAFESSETALLDSFWRLVKTSGGNVATWNGVWDLRFLVIRSLALGVPSSLPASTIRSWFARYRTYPHFDCRAVMTNWEPYRAGEGLAEWSSFLGVCGKTDGMSGKDVYPLYQLGHFDEIAEYCKQDVAATLAVYQRIAPMFAEAA
jgi:hypothetical protein